MNNATLFERAAAVTPGGVNSGTRGLDAPIVWAQADGANLYDADGRQYLDYHAAFGPIILGHNHPAVNQAVAQAMTQVDLTGVGTTELEIRLAEKVIEHVPSAEMALIFGSGTEATYLAQRLARAVTRRKKLVKFQGCFHGWHDYLLMNIISAPDKIGHKDPASAGMLPEAIENTIVLPFNDSEALEQSVKTQGDDIAAIILEPIPHNIGCVMPKMEFVETLRRLCDQHGIILIFDEVITGFRHGLGGYQAELSILPDLTTMAKAIANGYPCAVLAGRRELMMRFSSAGGDVFVGGTYNGHPVATSAALATIAELEDGTVHERIFRLGGKARRGLQEIADRLDIDMTVAGYGSVFVPYFMSGAITRYADLLRNNTEADTTFRREMVKRGIFMLPLAMKRNHISAAHTDADIDRTLNVAEDALKQMIHERGLR
ncbi:MAG: aspartate aminotransferase family protein [Chloroflexota bacterium]|nr:aspartate aminotransferase family protein [Chloroflexota bacterium]MDE2910106.1 aspartate aminotransferase family protein [Chloroflexota bacterium]